MCGVSLSGYESGWASLQPLSPAPAEPAPAAPPALTCDTISLSVSHWRGLCDTVERCAFDLHLPGNWKGWMLWVFSFVQFLAHFLLGCLFFWNLWEFSIFRGHKCFVDFFPTLTCLFYFSLLCNEQDSDPLVVQFITLFICGWCFLGSVKKLLPAS